MTIILGVRVFSNTLVSSVDLVQAVTSSYEFTVSLVTVPQSYRCTDYCPSVRFVRTYPMSRLLCAIKQMVTMMRCSIGFILLGLHLSPTHGSTSFGGKAVITNSFKQQNDLKTMFASQRKACRFYVWNVASAGLYSLCQHLCRDCKYEGRGGREVRGCIKGFLPMSLFTTPELIKLIFARKFLLIPPGSLLQLLFPCDQYSPDSCLWCGGSHVDHVSLVWSKRHLYSPFDMMLDRIKNQATMTKEVKVWNDVPPDIKTTYMFHTRYVVDIDIPPVGMTRDKSGKALYDHSKMSQTKTFGVRYLLPKFQQSHVARQIVTLQLNRLIEIQQLENEILELRQHGMYTRQRERRLKSQLLLTN